MATINPTIERIGNDAVRLSWALTTADFDGAPIGPNFAQYTDRSVHVFGTFGGGTLAWQGSNEGDPAGNWVPAADRQGVAIALTAAGQKAVGDVNRQQRPFLSGSAGASVTVHAYLSRLRDQR